MKTIEDIKNSGLKILKASIPGNFELDLYNNGIIEDPYFGMNILKIQAFEDCHVWYFTEFQAERIPNLDAFIVFEGIDTYADIYLNGTLLASTDNMLIEHRFIVNDLLDDRNELVIHIKPVFIEARKYDYSASVFALPFNYEALYVRKAPHMFGWDIMPRIISAGLWRPVKLEYKNKERIEEFYLQTLSISSNAGNKSADIMASFKLKIDSASLKAYSLIIEAECEDSRFSIQRPLRFTAGKFRFTVNNPKLWWPKGRGTANLYHVKVSLVKDNEILDQMTFTTGIRTAKLVRTSSTDEQGNGEFCFVMNGEKVFVKGTNWVPADAFHSRDRERIPNILKMVDDIGCNMIRCWGGNVYEDDIFYDLCDEYGIMVWQDFSFACAIYPQDQEFLKRISKEVEQVVLRLRKHPCIVLWAGDNECDEAHLWSGLGTDPNSNSITRKVIPEILKCHDPFRDFLPSSPYIDSEGFKKGERYLPERHLWGPRDYYKSSFYKDSLCHFASEIGYHGCPSPQSIRKFISPETCWPYQDNDEWIVHATSPTLDKDSPYRYRIQLMANQVKELFGEVPDSLDEFALASQISQAEALKFFIELFRSQKWRKTGIIWWNLMDGWPQFSDAVVDYYFEKKLAYSYIKRVQEPLCVIVKEPANWVNEVVVSNDMREDIEVEYEIINVENDEVVLHGRKIAPADKVTLLGSIPFSMGDKKLYLITWKTKYGRGLNHYLAGYPPFDFKKYVEWMRKVGFAEFLS